MDKKHDPKKFDTITDLLAAHGFEYREVGEKKYFKKDDIEIPADELSKHTPTTFYEKAMRKGWFSLITQSGQMDNAWAKIFDLLVEEDYPITDPLDTWVC